MNLLEGFEKYWETHLSISKNKAEKIFNEFTNNCDEPICALLDFKCPWSSFPEGHYCKGEDFSVIEPFCKEAFYKYLEDKLEEEDA